MAHYTVDMSELGISICYITKVLCKLWPVDKIHYRSLNILPAVNYARAINRCIC